MSFESKINFNGKEYSSLNDIPDEFKVMFKDENRNGIPDFVEGLLNTSQGSSVKPLVANFNSFFYNGRQYSSIDQMPPEAKEMVNKGLAKLEKSGFGIMMPEVKSPGTASEIPAQLKEEAQKELSPSFKFRVIMTIIFFVLAVIYFLWFLRVI